VTSPTIPPEGNVPGDPDLRVANTHVRDHLTGDPDPQAQGGALLAALHGALSERAAAERAVAEHRRQLAEAEHLAAQQERLIRRMRGSRSWRITAPIRRGTAAWRRVRGRGAPAWDGSSEWAPVAETDGKASLYSAGGSTLGERPWRFAGGVPREALEVSSMMTVPEKQLLYWLARHYYSGEGEILDAGCYLGGSTRALATGLEGRADVAGTKPIHSYDLFEVGVGTPDLVEAGLERGDSFRPLFERNLGPLLGYCDVVEGDFLDHGWVADRPIEIAFFDVLKTWALNDHALGSFFGSFIPGRTILVQQDFVHEYCPWIHVTMGHLDPYFELLDVFDHGSAVYLLREPIPPEALNISIETDLSPGDKVTFMDRAIEPVSGEMRGILEGAKAFLLGQLSGPAAMLTHLDYVEDRYGDSDQVLRSVRWLKSPISPWQAREPGRVREPGESP